MIKEHSSQQYQKQVERSLRRKLYITQTENQRLLQEVQHLTEQLAKSERALKYARTRNTTLKSQQYERPFQYNPDDWE